MPRGHIPVNARTEALLKAFIAAPRSSLIISSVAASDIGTIIDQIIEGLLIHKSAVVPLNKKGAKISVDEVREFKSAFVTRISGNTIGRVGIIYDADSMGVEAQNSLLKIVEEPPQNTLLILVSGNTQQLLSTIRSRCFTLPILPISQEQASKYADIQGYGEAELRRAYALSGGHAQLFVDIISGKESEQTALISTAKAYLQKTPFQRLAESKTYAKSEALGPLISALSVLAEAGLHSAQKKDIQRWMNIIRICTECRDSLKLNSSAKLVYLKLSLDL